jgi:hypothetical protein
MFIRKNSFHDILSAAPPTLSPVCSRSRWKPSWWHRPISALDLLCRSAHALLPEAMQLGGPKRSILHSDAQAQQRRRAITKELSRPIVLQQFNTGEIHTLGSHSYKLS